MIRDASVFEGMVLARGAATIATVGQEETAVAMSELEMLQRDIDDLLDTNRLDWLALANEPMSSEQRIEVQKAIAARNVDLLELLRRKWTLEEAGGDR